jgi:D-xylose transport system substrate-binding protein
LFLSACENIWQDKNQAQEKPLRIGFSIAYHKDESERWKKDYDYFINEAEKRNCEVITRIAEVSQNQQIVQVRELIAYGIDVLVLLPYESESSAVIIDEAHKAGLKVIVYDKMIANADADYYISFNNVQVGELQSKYLTKIAPQGNYFILGGSETDYNAKLFRQGQLKVLKPFIRKKEIMVVMDTFITGWNPHSAYRAVAEGLKLYRIDVILASNDALAGGAIKALREKRLAGRVLVSGQDADLPACRRLLDNTQTMTVYKSIRQLASKSVELAIKIAKKEKIEITETMSNGKYLVPSILLSPTVVDKINLENTVMKEGFHKKKELLHYK